MGLLRAASDEYDYDLQLGEIAKIWRGGCIIRARFLNDITAAYQRNPATDQPAAGSLLSRRPSSRGRRRCGAWCRSAVTLGIPCLAFSSALAYFDAYRTERLPANLTQAQR
jgi:6-phosphogluconate dehydrogenase